MKYIITESQYNRAIYIFLNYLFEPHEVKTSPKYPDSIFWVKDGEVIVEIEKSRYFWVDRDKWSTFSSFFSLKNDDAQRLIKSWLEEHYKLGELTPRKNFRLLNSSLEEHYKLGLNKKL